MKPNIGLKTPHINNCNPITKPNEMAGTTTTKGIKPIKPIAKKKKPNKLEPKKLQFLTFNKLSIENKIISICDYLNLNKNFESFLNWILELRNNLNIPHKLSDVMDCNNIDLDELSLMAFEDPSTGGNPKKLSQSDLKEMYIKSISGELF